MANNKKTTDLEYRTTGLFTTFLPSSKAGEVAYNEMLSHPDTPNAKIYTIHLKNMLYQLKKAGYTVKKAKKISKKESDKILTEIFNDPMFN